MQTIEIRTSEQGTRLPVIALRDFIRCVLQHDVLADAVNDLLSDHIVDEKYHPTVVTTSLQELFEEIRNTLTWDDWNEIRAELVNDARKTLNPEAPE